MHAKQITDREQILGQTHHPENPDKTQYLQQQKQNSDHGPPKNQPEQYSAATLLYLFCFLTDP